MQLVYCIGNVPETMENVRGLDGIRKCGNDPCVIGNHVSSEQVSLRI